VNLVDRPTIDVTELKKGEEQAGLRRALRIIRTYRPKVVCFIGKIAFNTFLQHRKMRLRLADGDWRRESLSDAFPIQSAAAIREKELTEVKRATGES
jgi:TDG/mug DNA glycosylase family protein